MNPVDQTGDVSVTAIDIGPWNRSQYLQSHLTGRQANVAVVVDYDLRASATNGGSASSDVCVSWDGGTNYHLLASFADGPTSGISGTVINDKQPSVDLSQVYLRLEVSASADIQNGQTASARSVVTGCGSSTADGSFGAKEDHHAKFQ